MQRASDFDLTTRKQTAGFQRRRLGGITITALYDGIVDIDPTEFAGISPAELEADLRLQSPPTTGKIATSVNAWIIDTGARVVMVDVGSGHRFGPTMGRLQENLLESGYAFGDIDDILITHLHPDHVGGASHEDLTAVYPNATLWAHQADAVFWLEDATAGLVPEFEHWFIKAAQDAVAPYLASGRFRTFEAGDALLDGLVTVVGLPGHTPGHSGFRLEADGETLLFWGDITHLPAVQLMHPSASIVLDIFPDQAVASREWALAETSSTGIWVAGSHQPFPGFGRVRRDGAGFAWVAAEYAALLIRS